MDLWNSKKIFKTLITENYLNKYLILILILW